MMAELVNKAEAGKGRGVPRYMFYGAFTAETKHINHWSWAWFKHNITEESGGEEIWWKKEWQPVRKRNWGEMVRKTHSKAPNVIS